MGLADLIKKKLFISYSFSLGCTNPVYGVVIHPTVVQRMNGEEPYQPIDIHNLE